MPLGVNALIRAGMKCEPMGYIFCLLNIKCFDKYWIYEIYLIGRGKMVSDTEYIAAKWVSV